MENKRLEFAAAAKDFADYLDSLKKQVLACSGEPEVKVQHNFLLKKSRNKLKLLLPFSMVVPRVMLSLKTLMPWTRK